MLPCRPPDTRQQLSTQAELSSRPLPASVFVASSKTCPSAACPVSSIPIASMPVAFLPLASLLVALVLLAPLPALAHIAQHPSPQEAAGHVLQRPGYLGISLRDLDATETARLQRRPAKNGTTPDGGAMIVTVDRDAPAWTAGLRPHDIVLELNGQTIDDQETLRHRLRNCGAGDALTLRIWRAGHEMTVTVTLGDQDAIAQNAMSQHLRPASSGSLGSTANSAAFLDAQPASTDTALAATSQSPRSMASTLLDALMPSSLYTGLEVAPLTPQLAQFFGTRQPGGLLVTAVSNGSPAQFAGLAAGDVLLRVGSQQLSSRNGLAHAVRAAHGGAVSLAVLRNHQELSLSLQPAKRR